jgi:hypothetical protein
LTYFTVFYPSTLIPLCRRIDRIVMRWARKKYKRLKRSNRRARNWLQRVRDYPEAVRALGAAVLT